MKIIYIDTETGSPNPRNCCLLQLSGAIEIDDQIKDKFNMFIRPFPDDPPITEEAIAKHKITADIIANNPDKFIEPQVAFAKFKELLQKYVDPYNKQDKYQFVGYNCQSFDDPVLRTFFSKNNDNYYGSWFWYPTIDVMQLYAAEWMPYRHNMQNFQLMTVAKTAGIKVDENRLHDGLYDVQITRELFIKRIRYYKTLASIANSARKDNG